MELNGKGTKKGSLISYLLFVCLMLGAAPPIGSMSPDRKTFIFPEIEGWEQSGEVETYVPGTLFEYINGAADLYLAYNFQELKVSEYRDEKKASVTVDIYRHGTPIEAFGIYSEERLPSATFIDIGVQGYIEKNILNFLIGPYYVKISSYNTGTEDQEILLTFAKKVVGNLGEKGALPEILTAFPPDGKVKNSEKFIAKKFLGYSFFHSAFTADYDLSGRKFKLFIIQGEDHKECKDMIQKYLEQIAPTDKSVEEGGYTISDPHHGEIDLYWRGAYLWGILNTSDSNLRSRYLKLLEEGLKKKK